MAKGKHILAKRGPQHVFGTAKVGERGQIVIPKEIRDLFNIQPGDTLLLLGEKDTVLVVSRPEVLTNLATHILDATKKEEE